MSLVERRQAIIEKHGPWTAHNIDLGGGVFTIEPRPAPEWPARRADYALAMAQTFCRKNASQLRALDLGCLEGGLSIALGRRGVEVVGLEIREDHLVKANFARDALGLSNVTFVQGDMLRISDLGLGEFDLIVCAGTLYHVDAPDLLPFVNALQECCRGVTFFDTHVAHEARESFEAEPGLTLRGLSIVEHPLGMRNEAEKVSRKWASATNDYAFWPTERSLINLFGRAGYSMVFRPQWPALEWPWQDRGFWVATSPRLVAWPDAELAPLPDPDQRPQHHPMLDKPVTTSSQNPSTKRL